MKHIHHLQLNTIELQLEVRTMYASFYNSPMRYTLDYDKIWITNHLPEHKSTNYYVRKKHNTKLVIDTYKWLNGQKYSWFRMYGSPIRDNTNVIKEDSKLNLMVF